MYCYRFVNITLNSLTKTVQVSKVKQKILMTIDGILIGNALHLFLQQRLILRFILRYAIIDLKELP